MENKDILSSHITWKKHPSSKRYYYFKENDKIILLRMNNFPDEPLYTLINGLEIEDLEDKPVGWTLENY